MPVLLTPPVVDDTSRRRFLTGLAAAGVLAGCGSGPPPAPAAPVAAPGRVVHRYGTTEVPAAPARVAALGFTDHDYLLAHGVVPVGVGTGEAPAGRPFGLWPWAADLLGNGVPTVLPYAEIDPEAVAALQPDLITGFASGMTEQEYALLSRIAPTVAQPAGHPDYFAPWDVITRLAGAAAGRTDRAEALVAGIESRFAAVRAAHPEFAGAELAYANLLEGGTYYVETADSPRFSVLGALGFRAPQEYTALAAGQTYVEVSRERADLLDRDVLLWETADVAPQVRADPLYRRLRAVVEGRDVFIADPLVTGALGYISVLSVPVAIDGLVAPLAAAVDGDPTTTAA